MSCNRVRWNWLLKTYLTIDEKQHNEIIKRFIATSEDGTSDDIRLEEAMLALGITPRGTDPDPPKRVGVTNAGAEEYEEIMRCMDILTEKP